MDERRLIERARSGDAAACAALVRGHYAAVYRLLAHLTRDVHAAEDLCQETFAAAWTHLGTFTGGSTFATWLHRIAYRRFQDWLRSGRRRRGDEASPASTARDPLASAILDEESRELYRALGQLDRAGREMLSMHYLLGMSYRQIADVTGEPPGTVKWRTRLAMGRLRSALGVETDNELEKRSTTSPPAARPAAAPRPARA